MVGVKEALNRPNVIGFSQSTTDASLTAIVSRATLNDSGFNHIFKIRLEITGGNVEFFPLGHIGKAPSKLPSDLENLTDDLASNANSGQANIVVTNIDRFAVGDYIYIQDNTYTNYEWKEIITVATGTDTLTCKGNLSNSYTTGNSSEVGVIGNLNAYMPIKVGTFLNESGMNFQSLYMRRTSATNVTVEGYVVLI